MPRPPPGAAIPMALGENATLAVARPGDRPRKPGQRPPDAALPCWDLSAPSCFLPRSGSSSIRAAGSVRRRDRWRASPRLSSPSTSGVSSSGKERTAMNTDAGIQNSIPLLRYVRQRASVLAFVPILLFASNISAQTSNLSVINASFLPINLEITDTLCDVVLFRGRITGNAKITLRSACLDRDGRVNLILTDLSRRQSYRFTGAPNTITLRRGSG